MVFKLKSALMEVLTNSYKDGMIKFLKDHPEYFDEAVQLALSDDQPYAWRSAWLLWSCIEVNDKRVRKYINPILDCMALKKSGHKRELLKILLKMELKEKHEAKLYDICVDNWKQINLEPSVRFTSLMTLKKMAAKYPELRDELVFLTQDHFLETLSPGIINSVRKQFNIED